MSGGANWDDVFSKIDLSRVDLSSDAAQSVLEGLLAKEPLERLAVDAAAVRQSAANARSDRELLANVIRIVGTLAKLA